MISTTTVLTSGTNPSTYGQPVTFTATVTPGGAGPPLTGSVSFLFGGVVLGSAPVSWNGFANTATITFAALPAGSDSLSAAYSGDANYAQSTSAALSQTVGQQTSSVQLDPTPPASSSYGQPITLAGMVGSLYSYGLPPTGTITFLDGVTPLGTASLLPAGVIVGAVSSSGSMSIATLAVGSHSISVTYAGDSNYTSSSSSPSTVTVNKASTTTALTSSVNPSALCQSVTFTAKVTAVSPGAGTPTGTAVFSLSGTPVATLTLSGGSAAYSTAALSAGMTSIGAAYGGDTNFNSSSASLSQTVNGITNWVLTVAPAASDPQQGVLVSFGPAMLAPLDGALLLSLGVDANQHVACDCGCACGDDNNQAGTAPLGLVYASATVNVQPIFLVSLASDFCSAVPSSLQAQLTWNGAAQGTMTFATTGHSSGDVYAMPLQVGSAVGTSGIYPWSVTAVATVGTFTYTRTASGTLPVVANGSSPFGAGWDLGGTRWLIIGAAGIALVDRSTGRTRYFTGTGPTYTSPANDQGTLVRNIGGDYTYTDKRQVKTNFNSSGQMTSQVDPHGLTQSIGYSAGLIQTITQPDGGVATLSYSAGLLTGIAEPGGRLLTPTYDVNSNLIGFVDAAGGIHTITYDLSNRPVNHKVGPLNTTYTYSLGNGTLTQVDRGLGTTLGVTAQATQGLGASTAINAGQALAALTDALSRTTTYGLDSLARLNQLQTADGAMQAWVLNAAGSPTVYVDQLGRATTNTYNAYEDLTQVAYADGTLATYSYELTFHQLTQAQDALGHITTQTYDTGTGDLLTQTDARGFTTTITWSNGLKQTSTDARGGVTTLTWDNTTRRQLTQTDPLGYRTTFGYDLAGNQATVQDARGNTTTQTFDGNRRVLTRTNAVGGVASYAYDMLGSQTSMIDELNRTTSATYDVRGLQVTKTEAVGTAQQRTTSMAYDLVGNLLYTTDALAEITSHGYDVLNRQVTLIEAFGTALQRATTVVFDVAGNVLSNIDARALITSYAYDLLNRQVLRIDAFGTALARSTTTTLDVVGNVLSTTNPMGVVTSYAYDADNRQTQRIDAYGSFALQRTTTTTHDAVGNVLSITSPLGVIGSYGYDLLNRQTQLIEAYGSGSARTTTTTLDAVGNVLSVTNPRGYTTSMGYDALNRRVQQIDAYGTALARTLTSTYDAVSNLLSVTNGLGVVASYGYDNLNRRIQQIDAYGTGLARTLTTMYDADDRVSASIDAQGFITTLGYDQLNRQITIEDAGGGVATTAYDLNDNVVNTIDPMGNTTTNSYDYLNRRVQITDARGGITTVTFDANDNMLSLTDPVNNRTWWLYDNLDRKVQETDPLGNSGTFGYDKGDRLIAATDRLGQQITYGYDLLNRQTGETWFNSGGSQVSILTFTFDPNDNLLTAAQSSGSLMTPIYYANTMTYDALDRETSVQAPFGSVLTSTFDAADNRTLVQDSFGGVTTRTYDVLNRVTTIQFGGVGQTPLRQDLTYTARDQMATQMRYSDLAGTTLIGSTSATYDPVARLSNLEHRDGTGTLLANMTNTYDLASKITAEVLNGGVPVSYAYDKTDELTNDSQATYGYDLNGNRTMAGYTTGPANEMTSDGTWNYYYDANGNLVRKVNISTGEVWNYGYDNRNRLLTVQDTTSGVQMLATYGYDPLGKRIEKDVWTSGGGTTTTRFGYDRDEIWADMTSGNALQMRYLPRARVLELVAWVSGGGTAAWPLTDRMGSVRNVVDNTGAVIDTITYDGFGNISNETNAANGGAYKAFGYRVDGETGWLRPDPSAGRYYDPVIGRWPTQDPSGFGGGDGNVYRYIGNNAPNATDPTGLFLAITTTDVSVGTGKQIIAMLRRICDAEYNWTPPVDLVTIKTPPPVNTKHKVGCFCIKKLIETKPHLVVIQASVGDPRIPVRTARDVRKGGNSGLGKDNPTTVPLNDEAYEAFPGRPGEGCGASVHTTAKNNKLGIFGAADPKGRLVTFPDDIILAHELCGHAFYAIQGIMKKQTVFAGSAWEGHDQAIKMQNLIAAEIYGKGKHQRGVFADKPGRGASCWKSPGEREFHTTRPILPGRPRPE